MAGHRRDDRHVGIGSRLREHEEHLRSPIETENRSNGGSFLGMFGTSEEQEEQEEQEHHN